MFAAVSGMRSHQLYLDVIGNNVANVNTAGFRATRVTFQDMLSQLVRAGGAPAADRGGEDPLQVGLGVAVAGTAMETTQGMVLGTGRPTDLAIQGDGFFILGEGQRTLYTRAGAFALDALGRLVDPATGLLVQGWAATATGAVDPTGPTGPLTIPLGQLALAQATTEAAISGNLDAATPNGGTATLALDVLDALGQRHRLTFTFTKTAANQWSWTVAGDGTVTSVTPTPANGATVVFTADGRFDTASNSNWWNAATGQPVAQVQVQLPNGAPDIVATVDLSRLTQLAGNGQTSATSLAAWQNGMPMGTLTGFSIGPSGEVVGSFSNGLTRTLGQVALATFANPGGLTRLGESLFQPGPASGDPQVGAPGTAGRGQVLAGNLEQANVDLARQFTDLILAQRGFQANARVITAADELLQDLVNLRR